jgi:hypothetical protein
MSGVRVPSLPTNKPFRINVNFRPMVQKKALGMFRREAHGMFRREFEFISARAVSEQLGEATNYGALSSDGMAIRGEPFNS